MAKKVDTCIDIYFNEESATTENLEFLAQILTKRATITKVDFFEEDSDINAEVWILSREMKDVKITFWSCTHCLRQMVMNKVDFFLAVYTELYDMWEDN